ncbi:MAG TPA: hypothetical protein VFA10_23735 [Ktedonobacteraceae bacterium]|nr:hypothetical protein [Ktedonobacteraceae bacterium]
MTNQDNQQPIDRAVTRKLDMQQNAANQKDQNLKVHGRIVSLSLIVFILATVVIIFLIFFIQSLFPDNKNLQSLLFAIGASLLASLLSTLLYAFVVEGARHQSEKATRAAEAANLHQVTATIVIEATNALSAQIEQRINKMLNEEATRLVSAWPELLPRDYFPPLNESNPHFREQLGKAVAGSQQYIFRGATARFVPSLLSQCARDNIGCSILIIDPRAKAAIRTYALNRYIEPANNKTLEDFQQGVREEIYRAIVQLFDLRHQFRIEMRMCQDNLFYRSEIVDDGAFVSFYVGEHRRIYPPTYFYTKTNGYFYYSAFYRDFQQSWDLAGEQFPMRAEMTQSDLEDFLFKIGAGDKSTLPGKIVEWRSHHV